jgi:hypothetical protein
MQHSAHPGCVHLFCCKMKQQPLAHVLGGAQVRHDNMKRHLPCPHTAQLVPCQHAICGQLLCCCCRAKDESTTQASLGLRVCGVMVAQPGSGQVWRVDRHWGKQLTPDTVGHAFTRFADNGETAAAGRGVVVTIRR